MEQIPITEQEIRDFCCLRLAPDSAAYVELAAEFEADPVNSRVGAYCRETEQIVRAVTDEDLNWEAMLNDWTAAEAECENARQIGPEDPINGSNSNHSDIPQGGH